MVVRYASTLQDFCCLLQGCRAVPPEEKRLSEAHKSEIVYKEILKRDPEKTMTRMDQLLE